MHIRKQACSCGQLGQVKCTLRCSWQNVATVVSRVAFLLLTLCSRGSLPFVTVYPRG